MALAFSTRYSSLKATQKNGSVSPVIKLYNQPVRTMMRRVTPMIGSQHFKSLKSTIHTECRTFAIDTRSGWGTKESGILKEFKYHPILEIRRCLCFTEQCEHFWDDNSYYAGHTDLEIRSNFTHGNKDAPIVKKNSLTVVETGVDNKNRSTSLFIRDKIFYSKPGDVKYKTYLDIQLFPYRNIIALQMGEKPFAPKLCLPYQVKMLQITHITRIALPKNENVYICKKLTITGNTFQSEISELIPKQYDQIFLELG